MVGLVEHGSLVASGAAPAGLTFRMSSPVQQGRIPWEGMNVGGPIANLVNNVIWISPSAGLEDTGKGWKAGHWCFRVCERLAPVLEHAWQSQVPLRWLFEGGVVNLATQGWTAPAA